MGNYKYLKSRYTRKIATRNVFLGQQFSKDIAKEGVPWTAKTRKIATSNVFRGQQNAHLRRCRYSSRNNYRTSGVSGNVGCRTQQNSAKR